MISRVLNKLLPRAIQSNQRVTLKTSNIFFLKRTFTSHSKDSQTVDSEEDYVSFPRENKTLNYTFNWALAKHSIPLSGSIFHNTVTKGETDDKTTQVLTVGKGISADEFEEIHDVLIEKLTRVRTLYIEEGELEGLYVRIVSSSDLQAKKARGTLNEVNDPNFQANVTVILENSDEIDGKTLVDTNKRLILSSNANKESLAEAINLVFRQRF